MYLGVAKKDEQWLAAHIGCDGTARGANLQDC